jgi:hypothetical protein
VTVKNLININQNKFYYVRSSTFQELRIYLNVYQNDLDKGFLLNYAPSKAHTPTIFHPALLMAGIKILDYFHIHYLSPTVQLINMTSVLYRNS